MNNYIGALHRYRFFHRSWTPRASYRLRYPMTATKRVTGRPALYKRHRRNKRHAFPMGHHWICGTQRYRITG